MTAAQLTDQQIWERLQGITRQFSDQELEKSEQLLADLGVVADRSEAAVSNANILLRYFDSQRHVPMDSVNIKALVKAYADKLVWTSQTAKRYFLLGLTDADAAFLNRWFEQGPGRLLIRDGEQGRENTVAIANYCRKVGGISWDNLNKAIDVLNPTSLAPGLNAPTLHWKTVPSAHGFANRTGLKNHAEAPQPEPEKKDNDRQYIGGRLNHAWKDPNAPAAPKVQDPNEGGGWKAVCEALSRDGTWADRDELSQVMDRARSQGKSWLETYQLMKQVQKDRHGFRARL